MMWALTALSNTGKFGGRALRKEFWWFYLFSVVVGIITLIIDAVLGLPEVLYTIWALLMILPSISVGVRRIHDSGHSGWWIIVPVVSLIFLILDSEPGENKFGPNPKEE